jgi:hypothetical protein
MKEEKKPHENVNAIISDMKDAKILDTKKVSDKWHTFGELYTQRLYLFSIICNQNKDIAWKSKKHFDEENDPMFNGDFIVGLYTPEGPASYHFKMAFWDMFDIEEIPNAPKYDGYTPKEALERFMSILNNNQKQIK